jgi:hypothetical protein
MVNTHLNVGCLVKIKPYSDLKKCGIRTPRHLVPFIDEVGVVVKVHDTHVIVLWQKSAEECSHFPHTLDKIAD